VQLLDRSNPADLRRRPGPLFEPLGHIINRAFEEHAKREENGSGLHPGAPPENAPLIADRYVPRLPLTSAQGEGWLPETLLPVQPGPLTEPPTRGTYRYGLDELTLMRSCVESVGAVLQVLGPVGCGKTFLLKYFRACLCPEVNRCRSNRPLLLPIYLDGNIQRSGRHRAATAAAYVAALEGRHTDWYATTVQDIEDLQVHLALATAEALNWFADSLPAGQSVSGWPAWLRDRPMNRTFDDILDALQKLQDLNSFRPVFLLDNLDRMTAAHQAAACFLGEAIVARGGYAVLSLRPETQRHLVRALDPFTRAHINLEAHDALREEETIHSILKLRLAECRRGLAQVLHHKPFMLGEFRLDVKDAQGLVGQLLEAIVHEGTLKRLRILTNRNRRYLLEAVAFLLTYAPLPDEIPAFIALGVVEDPAFDAEHLERWRRQRYPFIRDGLLTGPYETFIPSKVAECRWLGYMINVFCNGRATMPCNWTVRLNILFAAQHSHGRVLLVEYLWKAWAEYCAIRDLVDEDLYKHEFNHALSSLINAGLLESPSVYHIPSHTEVQGGWKLGITSLGRFYLDVCIENLAYVRFAKDSIEWKEHPSWQNEPRSLKLAGDTATGKERAENVARTMELLGTYEMEWMRDRVRQGDGRKYAALFTDDRCGCSVYGGLAAAMLKDIRRFVVYDASIAITILEDTVSGLRTEGAIAVQAT